MKNLLGYLTCVAVAILLRVYINGSGGTLVLYLLAIAFVISLAALLITKRKLVAAIKLSTEISAKNEEFDADIMLLNAIRIIPSCVVVQKQLLHFSEILIELIFCFRISGQRHDRIKTGVQRHVGITRQFRLLGPALTAA